MEQVEFDKISEVMLKIQRGMDDILENIRVKEFYKQFIRYIYNQAVIL